MEPPEVGIEPLPLVGRPPLDNVAAGSSSPHAIRSVGRDLPTGIAASALDPPVPLTGLNPRDGLNDAGVGHVPVLALRIVAEGRRVKRVEPEHDGRRGWDQGLLRREGDFRSKVQNRMQVRWRSFVRGRNRRRRFLPGSRRSRRQRCRRCDPSGSAAGDRRAPARSARSHRRTSRRSRAKGRSAGPLWSTGLPSRGERSPRRAAVQYRRVVAAAQRCSGFVVPPQLSAA
jgi:hypothetical protein